jgi:hypothetical protein
MTLIKKGVSSKGLRPRPVAELKQGGSLVVSTKFVSGRACPNSDLCRMTRSSSAW